MNEALKVLKLLPGRQVSPDEEVVLNEDSYEKINTTMRLSLIINLRCIFNAVTDLRVIKKGYKQEALAMEQKGVSYQELHAMPEDMKIINYVKTAFGDKFNAAVNWFVYRHDNIFLLKAVRDSCFNRKRKNIY